MKRPKKSSASKALTLKEAREKGKLDEFIKGHENDAPSDNEKLDKLLQYISIKKKKSQENDENYSHCCNILPFNLVNSLERLFDLQLN